MKIYDEKLKKEINVEVGDKYNIKVIDQYGNESFIEQEIYDAKIICNPDTKTTNKDPLPFKFASVSRILNDDLVPE